MITGKIENLSEYKGISKRIDMAIDYILNFDESMPDGKYEIDGDNVYANVVHIETMHCEDFKFEAHKRYIDLQYIISGSEIMMYAPVCECKSAIDYSDEKDVFFVTGEGAEMKMTKGSFYMVYPFDAHAPGILADDQTVRKVIVKIKY